MPESPKLLLIDGNNMAYRVFWANKNLSYQGRHTGVLFGFFKQLVMLHKEYPGHFRVVAWDGGYARRLAESTKAVEAGLIPSAYKATREDSPEKEAVRIQMEQLRDEGLNLVRCLQVRVAGIEADDVINTYAVKNRERGGESVIVSSDQDFYQCLGPGTTIRDAMKHETWTEERFAMEMGFPPGRWVDAGGIMGDTGDNIHGVDGWGPVTMGKHMREHGSAEAIMAALRAKEKRSKTEQKFVDSAEVLALAMSLKRMDVVEGLPKLRVCRDLDQEALKEYFLRFGFASLLKETWRLV